MKSRDSNTKETGTRGGGWNERVTLTNVIIHSGQKTVSRYIRPVVMHHVAFTFSKTKNVHPLYVHAFCLRVTRMREPTLVHSLTFLQREKLVLTFFVSFRFSFINFQPNFSTTLAL